jgi:DNA-directed RNA polymerase specialized sigma24 family protein
MDDDRREPQPAQELAPLVYDELRRLAGAYIRRERPGQTLQATALVHEAYLRLAGAGTPWHDKRHFVGIAARSMRQILVERARALNRLEQIDPEQARIVELRFFAGLSIEDAAEALNMSPATLKRRWALARAWLFRELSERDVPPA